MDIICLEEEAFYKLIEEVIRRLKEENMFAKEEKWISAQEAMAKLCIKGKTTLQCLRNEGKIRFSQPTKKVILYDVDSINKYLDKHARETF